MKNIYCEKCGGAVPGLDDDEFVEYSIVYNRCVEATKEYRNETGASLSEVPMNELYAPAIEKYFELTGFRGEDAFHLWRKHRVSRFPLYCSSCDLFYFAPTTSKCPCCGTVNA